MSSSHIEHELYVIKHQTTSELLWKLALCQAGTNRGTLIFSDLIEEYSTVDQGERPPRKSHNQDLSNNPEFVVKTKISSLKTNKEVESFWGYASKPLGQSNRHFVLHVLALLEGSKLVPDGTYETWRASLQRHSSAEMNPINRLRDLLEPSTGPRHNSAPAAGRNHRLAPVASPISIMQSLTPIRVNQSGANSPSPEPRALTRLRTSPRGQASSPGEQSPSPSHSSRSGSQREPSADWTLSSSVPRADGQTPPSGRPSAQRRLSSVQPSSEPEGPPHAQAGQASGPTILSNGENQPPSHRRRLPPINVRVPAGARPSRGAREAQGDSSRATDRLLCSEIDLFSPRSSSYPPNVFVRRAPPAASGASAASNVAQDTHPASPTAGVGRGRRSVRIAGVPGDSNTTSSLPPDNRRSRGPSPTSQEESSPLSSGTNGTDDGSESSPSWSPDTGSAGRGGGGGGGEGANSATPRTNSSRMPSAVTP